MSSKLRSIKEINALLDGPTGSDVTVTIRRITTTKPVSYRIKRDAYTKFIPINAQLFYEQVGYIPLPELESNRVQEEFTYALKELLKKYEGDFMTIKKNLHSVTEPA